MELSISNLGWHKKELLNIVKFLKFKKIKNLEYSTYNLKKHFSKNSNLKDIKNFWKINSIELYSMQSVLFKVKNAYIFGNIKQQKFFITK